MLFAYAFRPSLSGSAPQACTGGPNRVSVRVSVPTSSFARSATNQRALIHTRLERVHAAASTWAGRDNEAGLQRGQGRVVDGADHRCARSAATRGPRVFVIVSRARSA